MGNGTLLTSISICVLLISVRKRHKGSNRYTPARQSDDFAKYKRRMLEARKLQKTGVSSGGVKDGNSYQFPSILSETVV